MSFTPLGDALQEKMKQQSSLKGQIDSAELLELATKAFAKVFGNEHMKHIKPLFLKNRTLTVTCSNSATAQEIRINQAKIVKQMNSLMGAKEVDRIRYLS